MTMPYGSRQPNQIVRSDESTQEKPHYYYSEEGEGSNLFVVKCDEGWRISVVCSGMYEWAARWLVAQLQGKPYAPGLRP